MQIEDTTIKSDIVILPVYGSTEDFSSKRVEFFFEIN